MNNFIYSLFGCLFICGLTAGSMELSANENYLNFYLHKGHGYVELRPTILTQYESHFSSDQLIRGSNTLRFSLWNVNVGPQTSDREDIQSFFNRLHARINNNEFNYYTGVIADYILKFYEDLYINDVLDHDALGVLGGATMIILQSLTDFNIDTPAQIYYNEEIHSQFLSNFAQYKINDEQTIKVIEKLVDVENKIKNQSYYYNYVRNSCVHFPQEIYQAAGLRGHYTDRFSLLNEAQYFANGNSEPGDIYLSATHGLINYALTAFAAHAIYRLLR